MTDVYIVEIDGEQYEIEGDRPPTEAEARVAVNQMRTVRDPNQPTEFEQARRGPQGGALSRLLAPVGDAIRGGLEGGKALVGQALRPPSLNQPETLLNLVPGGLAAAKVAQGVAGSIDEQAQATAAAAREGRTSEAIGHGLATALPVLGPAAVDIGESLGEGDVAGAIGKGAVLAAPAARVPKFLRPTSFAKALKTQAAKRIIDVLRPRGDAAVAKARGIADDLVAGVPQVDETLAPGFPAVAHTGEGGIGVGSLDTLVARAKARLEALKPKREALQARTEPIDTRPVSAALRDEARTLETQPPTRKEMVEKPTGLVDSAGDPIMGIAEETITPPPVSGHSQLSRALQSEADWIDNLAAQYPDEAAPAGELFKQRAAIGRRVRKAYQTAPGDEAAAGLEAGQSTREGLTRLLHEKVPASVIPDREYEVFRNAATMFQKHSNASLSNRGLKGLKDLLAGRAASAVLGAATGATTLGPLGGVAGALGGVMLGESAYWGSLRAATYSKLATALNAGRLDVAADILQRSAAAYAADQGIRASERNRRAQRALQTQAEGVVVP